MSGQNLNTDGTTAIGWDDEISEDSPNLIIPPEGDYRFRVVDLIRGYFNGSSKLSPCNKATLRLEVETDEGTAIAYVTLYLDRTMEWKLSSFFRSIGQKKSGETISMDWDHVVGAVGRAHFKPETYKDTTGQEKQAIDVIYFIDYDADLLDDWIQVSEAPFN